jgi:hypothetical protein
MGRHRVRDNVGQTEGDDSAVLSHVKVILLRGWFSLTFIKKLYMVVSSLIRERGLNWRELIKKMNEISSEVLQEKDYIRFIDIVIRMGKLTMDDYEG